MPTQMVCSLTGQSAGGRRIAAISGSSLRSHACFTHRERKLRQLVRVSARACCFPEDRWHLHLASPRFIPRHFPALSCQHTFSTVTTHRGGSPQLSRFTTKYGDMEYSNSMSPLLFEEFYRYLIKRRQINPVRQTHALHPVMPEEVQRLTGTTAMPLPA